MTEVRNGVRMESTPYGCNNISLISSSGRVVRDGLNEVESLSQGTAVYNIAVVQHNMSTKCRYNEYRTDPKCNGCMKDKDDDYLKEKFG